MKFWSWLGEKNGYIAVACMFVFFGGLAAMTGCVKRRCPADRIKHEMVYIKDTKSGQCFAIAGKRMAWVPCSAVKDHLEDEDD